MDVEEETTSNHPDESMEAETTTVIKERLLETTTSTDKESEKELTKLISVSNAREEEESSVSVLKLEESEELVVAAVEKKVEDEEKGEEIVVDCRNSESVAALSGGFENSVVVESMNAVKEIDIPSDDVAAVECGGSELTCSVNLDGGDGEDAVVDRNGDLTVVEEGENEGHQKEAEEDEMIDQFENEDDVTVQLEIVNHDVENHDNAVAEVIKEEGMDADEEEEDGGVREDFNSENDDKETKVEDEEKSIDTEPETEKSLDTEMETEEEANLADEDKAGDDEEIESEPELAESSKKNGGGKRKRGGKISKATPKSPAASRKTIEEDVCFICFDGGDLVLCDRRNCPKAYHPSCVNRDEAFFQSKGRWNCGWHLCSICEKKAEYMCYTCTYSLCKACTKTSVILCVREKEKKGLCEACMKTVMLIEKQEDQGNVNFDDKNSWEHLFKDYWTDTKAKHNLSLDELIQSKNPWKGSGKQESLIAQSDAKDDDDLCPNSPPENLKTRKSKRNAKKQKSAAKEDDSEPDNNADWASKELLEIVKHMRNGDGSVISQFEVQDLLLEYIKKNKLRDPNRKSQIICDTRLENLFGKPRVAHIEMLKLLEAHYLTKEDSQIDDVQGTVVDTEVSPGDDKDKKRKGRKKGDRREQQYNRDDYAAIDIHNISLIYLRRKLVEDLLDDMEAFGEKIVGTFVRIRISGANQKQDIYRLVQVTGTSEAAQYTLGKRTTCTMLEILNLDKTETISIDSISNQEFMEDECKRLRQSIKCGFISRLTVGDVLDKAMELQAARVNDWLETEIMRLSHLRDRASDLGRKKELRECVEKLDLLKTPKERARRLEDFPVVHDDPTMDPEYGSEDDSDSDDKKQELYQRSGSFRFNKRGPDPFSDFSPRGNYASKESWSGTPRTSSSSKNYEFTRNPSNKNYPTHTEDTTTTSNFETRLENSRDQIRAPLEMPPVPTLTEKPVAPDPTPKINESEKMWHYKDPSDKIQGPFSMTQLRKWSKNGYFPVGLKIWRKSEKEDDGINLNDALEGNFTVVDPKTVSQTRPNSNVDPANPKNSRHDIGSLPSPTPNKVNTGWTAGQGGSHPGPGLTEGLLSPTPPSLAPCGNNDANIVGPVGVLAVPQNVDQGPVQLAQLGQQPPDNNMQPPQMVHGWTGGGPVQNLQPNPAMNMAAYNQWGGGGVPNMVQNPAGNFIPQETWGPFPVNMVNMPQPPQPMVNWGTMGSNPNMNWVGPNPGNQMNWVGPVDPNWGGGPVPGWVQPPVQGVVPNQNWVNTPVQGPMNPGWVGPPTNQVGQPNWGAPAMNQGPVNMNNAWVGGPPPVNNNNMGWVPPAGNQPPPPQPPVSPAGKPNQNYGSRNHGNWGGNENRGSFSGQRRNRDGFRGNRRDFNKHQEPYRGKDGGSYRGGSGDSGRSSDP